MDNLLHEAKLQQVIEDAQKAAEQQTSVEQILAQRIIELEDELALYNRLPPPNQIVAAVLPSGIHIPYEVYTKPKVVEINNRQKQIDEANTELRLLMRDINHRMETDIEVAIWTGCGEKLRQYAKGKNAHDKLSGLMHSLGREIDRQRREGMLIIPPDSPQLLAFNSAAEEFAGYLDDLEKGKDDGQKLIAWIEQHGTEFAQISLNLKREIDLGGPTRNPAFLVLKRLADPHYAKHQHDKFKWRHITRALEAQIKNPQTYSEKILAQAWEDKSYQQRKKQVEYVFTGKGMEIF